MGPRAEPARCLWCAECVCITPVTPAAPLSQNPGLALTSCWVSLGVPRDFRGDASPLFPACRRRLSRPAHEPVAVPWSGALPGRLGEPPGSPALARDRQGVEGGPSISPSFPPHRKHPLPRAHSPPPGVALFCCLPGSCQPRRTLSFSSLRGRRATTAPVDGGWRGKGSVLGGQLLLSAPTLGGRRPGQAAGAPLCRSPEPPLPEGSARSQGAQACPSRGTCWLALDRCVLEERRAELPNGVAGPRPG